MMEAGSPPSPDSFLKPDGSLSVGRVERVEAIRSFFATLGARAPRPPAHIASPQLAKPAVAPTQRVSALLSALNESPSVQEATAAISRLKSGTAAGPDGLPVELLKRAGPVFQSTFASLLAACWQSGRVPKMANEGLLTILHKSGSTDNLSNYRGLSLLNGLSKAMEYAIKARLSPLAEEVLSDSQAGFRKAHSCYDQHLILSEILRDRQERGLLSLVIFIDVKKAYDSVHLPYLWARLRNEGVTGPLFKLIKSLAGTIRRKVRFDGDESEWFEVLRGVPQGGVLSPILYDLFIDDLLRELDHCTGFMIAGCNVPDLAFADDIALIAGAVSDMNSLLAVLHRHSSQFRYEINPAKCGVMAVGTPSQEAAALHEAFHFGAHPLPVTPAYHYLGIIASALRGRLSAYVEERIDVARAKLPLLSGAAGCRFNGLKPTLALRLWKSLILPGLERQHND